MLGDRFDDGAGLVFMRWDTIKAAQSVKRGRTRRARGFLSVPFLLKGRAVVPLAYRTDSMG